jgi:hypothetical protein
MKNLLIGTTVVLAFVAGSLLPASLRATDSGLPSWMTVGSCFRLIGYSTGTAARTTHVREIDGTWIRKDNEEDGEVIWYNMATVFGVSRKSAEDCAEKKAAPAKSR